MATYKEMRTRALVDPEVRTEYDRLDGEEFALLDQMLAVRREAGLTQAQIAERMGTKAPAITRLERAIAAGSRSPTVETLARYAQACGKKLIISFA